MKVITVRNVHEALPRALKLLKEIGVQRESRNGPVLVAPCPVTTVYEQPCERVIFWPERDANPFFHLYEALWMLAGRRDLVGPVKYAKNMGSFSDDQENFHGAYGYRWRNWFAEDQLVTIASQLRKDPQDRRCVLGMWDTNADLGKTGKDFPCNVSASFQRGAEGELNLTVFCRSNDIVWGAYGANAVQFSMLLEYMALWIDCPVGTYTQISVNWHGYLDTLGPVRSIKADRLGYTPNPYFEGLVKVVPIDYPLDNLDTFIKVILSVADAGGLHTIKEKFDSPWGQMVLTVLLAHEVYRKKEYKEALHILNNGDQKADWIVAAREWVLRRELKRAQKNEDHI